MVTFDFYTDTYHGGSISASEWPVVEREASAHLARMERIYTVTGDDTGRKMAVCAMAEKLVDNAKKSGVSSASIGSVSVSYAQQTNTSTNRDMLREASLYLRISRGVY